MVFWESITGFPPGGENCIADDHWRTHEWLHWPDRWDRALWKWVLMTSTLCHPSFLASRGQPFPTVHISHTRFLLNTTVTDLSQRPLQLESDTSSNFSFLPAREPLPTWDKQIQSLCFQVNNLLEKIRQAAPEWAAQAMETQMTQWTLSL